MGDVLEHQTVLKFGMFLFNISTLTCAVVNQKIGLVVGRAFRGLAAGLTIPSAQAFVSLLFEDAQARMFAFAIWEATGSTGFVLGPYFDGLFSSLVT